MSNNPDDLTPPPGIDPKLAAYIIEARKNGDTATLAMMTCGVYLKRLLAVGDTLHNDQIVDVIDCIFAALRAAGVCEALRIAAEAIENFPNGYSQERRLALLMDSMAREYPEILKKRADRLHLIGEAILFPNNQESEGPVQ